MTLPLLPVYHRRVRIGVDSGGTFTDFAWVQPGADGVWRRHELKLPSTPRDPAEAVVEGVERILAGLRQCGLPPGALRQVDVIHGTTVATNTLLTRSGARVALLTTAGFEDVLDIGRQDRPQLYDLHPILPPPLVPRELRFGLRERLDYEGRAVLPLSAAETQRCAAWLRRAKPQALAVCLLHSYANAAHETAVAAAIGQALPGLPVFLSSALDPWPREYERISTTVIHAYLSTALGGYITKLAAGLPLGCLLRLVGSNGGIVSAEEALRRPADLVLSGPAAGAQGAALVARRNGCAQFIGLDMGGTSTDVCYGVQTAAAGQGWVGEDQGRDVAGLPLRLPRLAVHSVGAGGGSIARLGLGGALLVGPESAGADPGPAAYGSGDFVTVTDADLILGRLPKSTLLGGQRRLDGARSRRLLGLLAQEAGLTPRACASGIVELAGLAMAGAVGEVTQCRGIDPRGATLIPFGGAGGMHACDVAARLGIRRILFPGGAGCLSAIGALLSRSRRDSGVAVLRTLTEWTVAGRDALLRALRSEAVQGIAGRAALRFTLHCRYPGQSFELPVPAALRESEARLAQRFHRVHRQVYGYALAEEDVEVVAAQASASGPEPRVAGVWQSAEPHPQGHTAGPVTLARRGDTIHLERGWRGHWTASGDLLAGLD